MTGVNISRINTSVADDYLSCEKKLHRKFDLYSLEGQ